MRMENGANVAKMLLFFSFLLTNGLGGGGKIKNNYSLYFGGHYESKKSEAVGILAGLLVGVDACFDGVRSIG